MNKKEAQETKVEPNPFYHDYVFSRADIDRAKIKLWQWPILWFGPTYIQLTSDGYDVRYKQVGPLYFLLSIKEFKP